MTRTLVTSLGAGARGNSYLRVLHRFPCGAEHPSSLIGYSLPSRLLSTGDGAR